MITDHTKHAKIFTLPKVEEPLTESTFGGSKNPHFGRKSPQMSIFEFEENLLQYLEPLKRG